MRLFDFCSKLRPRCYFRQWDGYWRLTWLVERHRVWNTVWGVRGVFLLVAVAISGESALVVEERGSWRKSRRLVLVVQEYMFSLVWGTWQLNKLNLVEDCCTGCKVPRENYVSDTTQIKRE